MKIEELIAFLDVGEYGTELLDYGWGPPTSTMLSPR